MFWLLSDEFLVRQIGVHCLAPLGELTVKQRARLSETLLVLLRSRGSARKLAERLGVHPRIVGYRMNKLEQLFGDRLNDSEDRTRPITRSGSSETFVLVAGSFRSARDLMGEHLVQRIDRAGYRRSVAGPLAQEEPACPPSSRWTWPCSG